MGWLLCLLPHEKSSSSFGSGPHPYISYVFFQHHHLPFRINCSWQYFYSLNKSNFLLLMVFSFLKDLGVGDLMNSKDILLNVPSKASRYLIVVILKSHIEGQTKHFICSSSGIALIFMLSSQELDLILLQRACRVISILHLI